MKKSFVILVLVLVTIVTACWAHAEQSDPMSVPASSNSGLPEGYDPASEEDHGVYSGSGTYNDYGRSVYAGATPIPLDPIDMPTPTPKPAQTFTYGAVTADKIKLNFEAPVGWYIDNSADDAITLTDPNALDGFNASLTLRLYPVASTFRTADLRNELKNVLKELGQYNFASWTTTEMASRTLLKKDGYYADYHGTYYNDTAIYGRVMMALLDNHQIIMLHMVCPDGYFNNSYKAVVNHVRDTLSQQK